MAKRSRIVDVVFRCRLRCGGATNAVVQKKAESRFEDLVPNTPGWEILTRSAVVTTANPPPKSRASRLADAAQQIRDGYEEANAIKEELEEWRGNMEGTGLENTEKYSDLDTAVGEIESALDENVSDAPDSLENVTIPGAF